MQQAQQQLSVPLKNQVEPRSTQQFFGAIPKPENTHSHSALDGDTVSLLNRLANFKWNFTSMYVVPIYYTIVMICIEIYSSR